jgi:hypothetical protein
MTPARRGAGTGHATRPRAVQFVTVIDGACSYQLAISDETRGPELKSTRSHPVPDHVWTE